MLRFVVGASLYNRFNDHHDKRLHRRRHHHHRRDNPSNRLTSRLHALPKYDIFFSTFFLYTTRQRCFVLYSFALFISPCSSLFCLIVCTTYIPCCTAYVCMYVCFFLFFIFHLRADPGGTRDGHPRDGGADRGDRRPVRGARRARVVLQHSVEGRGAGAAHGVEQGAARVSPGFHPRRGMYVGTPSVLRSLFKSYYITLYIPNYNFSDVMYSPLLLINHILLAT